MNTGKSDERPDLVEEDDRAEDSRDPVVREHMAGGDSDGRMAEDADAPEDRDPESGESAPP